MDCMVVFPFLRCEETRDRCSGFVARRKYRAALAVPAGDRAPGTLSPSIAVWELRNLLSRLAAGGRPFRDFVAALRAVGREMVSDPNIAVLMRLNASWS
jgi:hypothetical protein